MAGILIPILVFVVLTVVINKTTEDRFHSIKPHLREVWWVLGFIYITYWILRPESESYFMARKNGFGASHPAQSYVLAATLGAVLFIGYWWFLGLVLPPSVGGTETERNQNKPAVGQTNHGNNNTNITGNDNVVGNNNTINRSDPKVLARLAEIKK